MLQTMMRKILLKKQSKSVIDINLNPDLTLKKWQSYTAMHPTTDETSGVQIRRQKKEKTSYRGWSRRKRIVSCPDAKDLREMHSSLDIDLIDLKKICEQGELFLKENDYCDSTSDVEEVFSLETDKEEEDVFGSNSTLEDIRC